jgi:hypothetical protein
LSNLAIIVAYDFRRNINRLIILTTIVTQGSPKPFVFKKANVKASLNCLNFVWMVGNDKIQEHDVFAFGYCDNDPSFSGVCKNRILSFKPKGGSSLQPDEKNKISLKVTPVPPSSISRR